MVRSCPTHSQSGCIECVILEQNELLKEILSFLKNSLFVINSKTDMVCEKCYGNGYVGGLQGQIDDLNVCPRCEGTGKFLDLNLAGN
jgi:RecJ-like exonuclease